MDNQADSHIKIMIVDDEYIMRKGFGLFFDWNEFKVKQVYEAENSTQAVDIAKKEKPDIVFTDIRMPDINGLDLINRLREYVPHALFVIISAYNDFDYAKRAIALGAVHYLMKPINEDELKKVLNNCVITLEERSRQRKLNDKLKLKLQEALPVLRDNYIMNIIKGFDIQSNEYCIGQLRELEIDIINKYYAVVNIRECGDNNLSGQDRNLMNVLIKEFFYDHVAKTGENKLKFYGLINTQKVEFLISFNNYDEAYSVINKTFNRLLTEMEKVFNARLICSIGPVVDQIKDIYISAEKSQSILEYKGLIKEGGIICYNDISEPDITDIFLLSDAEKRRLLYSLQCNDSNEIRTVIKYLKDSIKRCQYISTDYIYSTILELIVFMTRYTAEKGFTPKQSIIKVLSFQFISSFNNIDKILMWVEDYLINLSHEFANFIESNVDSKIEKVKEYIDNNIASDISLENVARKFHYNSSYLSRLFKNITGRNFSVYVNETKIKTAKKLLTSTDLPAYVVCKKVGYGDYKHFVKVFKKETGISPGEYRIKHQK